jgi:hypothetical protein
MIVAPLRLVPGILSIAPDQLYCVMGSCCRPRAQIAPGDVVQNNKTTNDGNYGERKQISFDRYTKPTKITARHNAINTLKTNYRACLSVGSAISVA